MEMLVNVYFASLPSPPDLTLSPSSKEIMFPYVLISPQRYHQNCNWSWCLEQIKEVLRDLNFHKFEYWCQKVLTLSL